MSPFMVHVSFIRNSAIALFPFILFKNKASKSDAILLNHERIHLKQQLELLILPFYIIYLFQYLINLLIYRNHYKAYINIVFEKEAFHNERYLNYLQHRKPFSFLKFFYTHTAKA